jgi:hypothetical protein
VYDYSLGRLLSVDPIISNPANSQSINPYSYIGNNPLSGVDPTGYQVGNLTQSTENQDGGDQATRKDILSKINDARKSGAITDKTSVADAGKIIGADIVGAFQDVFARIVGGNGGGTTTAKPDVPISDTSSPAQVGAGRAETPEERDVYQAAKDRGWQARGAQETLDAAKPYAEAAATMNPAIAASVAITGEKATGGEASAGERVAAGAVAGGPLLGVLGKALKTGWNWAKGLFGRGEEAIATARIVAANGTQVTGFTSHGIDRVIGDGGDRAGVVPHALLDALRNPEGSSRASTPRVGRSKCSTVPIHESS